MRTVADRIAHASDRARRDFDAGARHPSECPYRSAGTFEIEPGRFVTVYQEMSKAWRATFARLKREWDTGA